MLLTPRGKDDKKNGFMDQNYLKYPYLFLIAFFLLTISVSAREGSTGYQLAVFHEQKLHPEKILTRETIRPSDATIREFEWIMETLRHRCKNTEQALVSVLVETWRIVQRRGYDVSLLEYSRELASFSNIAFQSYRNQKVDLKKVALKWIKDKYPIKH